MNDQPETSEVEACRWSPNAQDACPWCSGEACAQCEYSYELLSLCSHASDERHFRSAVVS
jgi:hypothetical protein